MLVFGVLLERIACKIQKAFPSAPSTLGGQMKNPFSLFTAILLEYSSAMGDMRLLLYRAVRRNETGFAPVIYDHSLRAHPDELHDSTKDLHVVGGFMIFFEGAVTFQIEMVSFFREQHLYLQELFKRRGINITANTETHKVGDSFNMILSRTRNLLVKVRVYGRRIEDQMSSIESVISRDNSKANILLATQSAQIALETRRDSIVMKTIAGLTMVFLPATFVAVRSHEKESHVPCGNSH